MGTDLISSVRFAKDGSSLFVAYKKRLEVYSCDRVFDTDHLDPQEFASDGTNLDVVKRIEDIDIFLRISSSYLFRRIASYEGGRVNSDKIVNFFANEERIVVCFKNYVKIYDTDRNELHICFKVPPNPKGIFDLSSMRSLLPCLLAYPNSSVEGRVMIHNAETFEYVREFRAHESAVAALKFSPSGILLATASIKGTIIRVYNAFEPSSIIYQFRRGFTSANIASLSFSADSQFLCSSSDTKTVHIFELSDVNRTKPSEGTSWLGTLASAISGIVPKAVADCSTPRSVASLTVPGSPSKIVVGMNRLLDEHLVLVATTDGFLYVYRMKSDVSDKIQLEKQFRIESRVGSRDVEAEERTDDSRFDLDYLRSVTSTPSNSLTEHGAGEIADFSEIADQDNMFRAEEEKERREMEGIPGLGEDSETQEVPQAEERGVDDVDDVNWSILTDDQIAIKDLD